MEKVRFGIIGAGGIAERRTIPGMMLAKNAILTAVMDVKDGVAERIAKKYDCKYFCNNTEELVNNPEVDAVYIASPVVFHAEAAKLAADYGKHILIEKPIAFTSDEGRNLVNYCESKGVKIAAGFMMRFGSHVQNMRNAVREGKIGKVVSGYAQFTLWLPKEEGNWRQEKAKAGGGCLMDMGVHCIDLVEYITGSRVTHVGALNETISFDYDVEDTSTVMLRMDNGAQCVVQTNFNIPDEASKWRLELFGMKGRLLGDTIIGQNDGGTLNAVFIEKDAAYDAVQNHCDNTGIYLEGEYGNMYTREIESFCDSLINSKPLEVPASDAVHVQEIIEKAYRSTKEKRIFEVLP